MITVQQLSKSYADRKRGEVRAVDSVTLQVTAGQIYGLVGANGAGKTTLMRMLATLIAPTAGSAAVAGCDLQREASRVRSHVGFLAASTALYARLTARELIAYFGRLHGLGPGVVAARIQRLADELDMHEFLDRRTDGFSTGMKQKTSIARVLIHDPSVMIFDEPTLGLDVLSARAITRFVGACRERGKTVLYSTHLMHEVEKLCDRIGVIHQGRLVAEGSLEELRERTRRRDIDEVFLKLIDAEDAR